MCIAVKYYFDSTILSAHYTHRSARLPVRIKSGGIKLITWGRRERESGILPLGGWAKLHHIYAGKWDKFFPKPVKLPIAQFAEYNFEQRLHWHHINKGECIQGLVVRHQVEQRLYIVTIIPEEENTTYNQWPRIILDS